MLPPAPDLFSTTTGTPSLACSCCWRIRPSRSAEPPAANGTTIVTCRCGHPSCAVRGDARTKLAANATANDARIGVAALWFLNGARLGRVADLDDEILDRLVGTRVARHRMQSARRFIEGFPGLELAHWSVADLDLVGPLEDVPEGVMARMPMRRAGIVGIAFGDADPHLARDVGHRLRDD